ncbi:MAG: replication-associated recombination protein A [Firmicutes bacterium]|nr:replication-associated recombination protein A [Bacillota bacterium]
MIPLSTRMRPDSLKDFYGQTHFMYKGSLFYNAIKNNNVESAVFFGPSGTGKTTLARMIAKEMDTEFYELNASVSGIKELKEIIEKVKNPFFGMEGKTPYVYIDEIHRWNKLQQDSLLQVIEEGVIRVICSTTENPYFSLNNAILSRIRAIYEFKPLAPEEITEILRKALIDEEKGLGKLNITAGKGTLEYIAEHCCGDARMSLDTLGFICENIGIGEEITPAIVGEALQTPMTFFDRKEDKYNLLSALQKSIRGSDPDAAVHYIARLIEGGADVNMIGRRLMVIASEDVGMAYPTAISIVTSCVEAAQMTGFPEARIMLAHAAVLLSSCPKSNSVITAVDEALHDVKNKRIDDVPLHLKDAHYEGAKDRGIGLEYKYPHSYGGYVKQQYLPDNLYKEGVKYYRPTNNGKEGAFKKFLEALEQLEKQK